MIFYFGGEMKNEYMRMSWNIFKFLLLNRNNPESEEYRRLTEELFDVFSRVYNINSIEEPNEFILSLSFENGEDKYEISFADVAVYRSEFPIKKQLLEDALNFDKEDFNYSL